MMMKCLIFLGFFAMMTATASGYSLAGANSRTMTNVLTPRNNNSNKSRQGLLRAFEAKELRLQLDAMNAARIRVKDVDLHRRRELQMFADKLISYQSPIAVQEVAHHLAQTKWRLAFTTDEHVLKSWHDQARSIHLEFEDNALANYVVTLGRQMMPVKHRLQWASDSHCVRFSDATSIKDHLECMHDAALDKLGLLKSRKPLIETAYFDGDVWIERSRSPFSGNDFSNVFLREP